jgi:cAMP-dependent protein kinase regulator
MQMYENMLSKVSVLRSLEDYERSTIADALRPQTYCVGDCIVKERDRLATGMYIIEQGAARVTVTKKGTEETVAWLGVGDYFGEYALLYDLPRTASVYAASANSGHEGVSVASGSAGITNDKVSI